MSATSNIPEPATGAGHPAPSTARRRPVALTIAFCLWLAAAAMMAVAAVGPLSSLIALAIGYPGSVDAGTWAFQILAIVLVAAVTWLAILMAQGRNVARIVLAALLLLFFPLTVLALGLDDMTGSAPAWHLPVFSAPLAFMVIAVVLSFLPPVNRFVSWRLRSTVWTGRVTPAAGHSR